MLSEKLNIKFRFLQISLLVLVFSSTNIISQEDVSMDSSEEIMTSVYNDVWLPFMESYREMNIEKFKSLQANDLTRVSIDRNTIQAKSKYFESIEAFFNQFKQANRQMDIRFSILSTATGENKVYQTGYYGFSSRVSDSEAFKPLGYGYFTVVLIKEEGQWKISLDADKQAAIDEDEFGKSETIYKLN